jgi:hypothetical protein
MTPRKLDGNKMPTFDFTSPDGKSYSIEGPEGATRDDAFKMLQLRLSHKDEDAPVTAEGLAKAGASGVAKGGLDLAGGIPALSQMMHSAANKYLFDPVFNALSGRTSAPEDQSPNPSAAVGNAIASVEDRLHKPQNTAERYVDTVGQFAPQAAIGGVSGLPGRLMTQAVAPGIASQAATDAGAGPIGSTLASIAGGGLAGATAARLSAAKKVALPTIGDVDAAAKASYNDPELKNLKLQPQPVSQLGDAIKHELENTHGMFRDDHAGVYSTLDRLSGKTGPVSFPELDAIRKSLGNKANEVGPTYRPTEQATAAIKAKDHLDNFIDQIGVTNPAPIAMGNGFTLPNPTIASGNPAAAVAALKNARANSGAVIRSREVQGRLNDALVGANVANSGMNAQNRIRQTLAPYLKKGESKMNSYTPEEQAAMRSTVLGNLPINALRYASNLLPSSGGLATMVGIGGHMAAGLPGAAIPFAGYALKKIANYATKRQAQKVADKLLERAPAMQPAIAQNRAIAQANSQAMRQRATSDAMRAAAAHLLARRNNNAS